MAKRPTKKTRRPRRTRDESRAVAAVSGPHEIRVITADNLNALIDRVRREHNRRSNANGQISGLVTEAVETQSLHRRAFRMFQQLDKLTDLELASTWHHLNHYMHVTGAQDRATAQGNLFPGNGAFDDEEVFEEYPAAAEGSEVPRPAA